MTVIKVSTVDSKCNKGVRVGEWAVSVSRLDVVAVLCAEQRRMDRTAKKSVDVVTDTCWGGFCVVCGKGWVWDGVWTG